MIAIESRGIPRNVLLFTRMVIEHAKEDNTLRKRKVLDKRYAAQVLEKLGLDINMPSNNVSYWVDKLINHGLLYRKKRGEYCIAG